MNSIDRTHQKYSSLRKLLLFFIALVFIVIIAAVAWSSATSRATILQAANITTANMARTVSQQARSTVQTVDNVLFHSTNVLEAGAHNGMTVAEMRAFLEQRVEENAMLHGLFLCDAKGSRIIAAGKYEPKDDNCAVYGFFTYHNENMDRGPHVGTLLRIEQSGERAFTISRRLDNADGSFAGVIGASIELDEFRTFYESVDVGLSGSVILATDTGIVIVRHPYIDTAVGKDIYDSPLFRQLQQTGNVGSIITDSPLDGIRRLYSYRAVEYYPLVVAVSLSFDDVLQDWRKQTQNLAIGTAIALALLALLARRLLQKLGAGERSQVKLHASKNNLERENEELGALAMQDGLTGLANRRRFDEALITEFARGMRSEQALSLVMIDIDYFKKYNDTYGHQRGDVCLQAVSNALQAISKRPGDLVARYGGEEIAVLLPSTEEPGAMLVAEQMRMAIRNLALPHIASDKTIVTISVGVATMIPRRNGSVPEHLIRAADRALYTAKEQGRDQVCFNNATVVVLM